VYKIYIEIIKALQCKYGNQWRFLIRLHPNLYKQSDLLQIPECVINVTAYPDIQELLGITDFLISDYSSVMFDYMFTRRPVFIYASDYELYKKMSGCLFFFRQNPFLFAENNEQFINNIMSFNADDYNKKIDDFISLVGGCENGNASNLVVDKIINVIDRYVRFKHKTIKKE
jgi:CDP-glycerol glycerophosphotransferase